MTRKISRILCVLAIIISAVALLPGTALATRCDDGPNDIHVGSPETVFVGVNGQSGNQGACVRVLDVGANVLFPNIVTTINGFLVVGAGNDTCVIDQGAETTCVGVGAGVTAGGTSAGAGANACFSPNNTSAGDLYCVLVLGNVFDGGVFYAVCVETPSSFECFYPPPPGDPGP